jgi:phosphopantetheine adenylyltransferase
LAEDLSFLGDKHLSKNHSDNIVTNKQTNKQTKQWSRRLKKKKQFIHITGPEDSVVTKTTGHSGFNIKEEIEIKETP